MFTLPQKVTFSHTEKASAPAHWATALINGDESGMTSAEIEALDVWLDSLAWPGMTFGITLDPDQEAYFGRWYGDWGQDGVNSGDLLDYTVMYYICE